MNRDQPRPNRIAIPSTRWWLWPAVWVGIATVCFVLARLFEPATDEFCYVFGHRFGSTCQFTVWTGQPCPQCGMTRSWVWAARMHFSRSFFYNPAGFTLFVWIQAAGLVGVIRLLLRSPDRLRLPFYVHFGWGCFWFVVLYVSLWFGRLAGINPLP